MLKMDWKDFLSLLPEGPAREELTAAINARDYPRLEKELKSLVGAGKFPEMFLDALLQTAEQEFVPFNWEEKLASLRGEVDSQYYPILEQIQSFFETKEGEVFPILPDFDVLLEAYPTNLNIYYLLQHALGELMD